MIDDSVKQNIDGLIINFLSNGVNKLSATKLLLLINDKYRIELDQNGLEEILSNNPSIQEINGDQIILGTPEAEDEQNTDDSIHDKAVDQASKELTKEAVEKRYNEIFEAFIGKTVGKEIKLPRILDESLENYHLLNALSKKKSTLIVQEIKPSQKLSESYIKCKIKGSDLTVEVPMIIFKK